MKDVRKLMKRLVVPAGKRIRLKQYDPGWTGAMEEARAWAAVPACHPKVRDANLAVESLLTAIDDVGPSSRDIDALLTRLDHNGGTARWRNNQSS